jgi:hypothetical protein
MVDVNKRCPGKTQCTWCHADDPRQPDVVLVLEYVEGPPLVDLAVEGTCRRLAHPVAQRLFADAAQVRVGVARSAQQQRCG